MSTSPSMTFQEFLRAKAEEYGVRDRHQLRNAWIDSLNQLLDQLQEWLQQADPESLLDIVRYKVARTERGFGTYDAPAMKIRLGAGEVDIVPISAGNRDRWVDPAAGLMTLFSSAARVDVTDGYRKYNLVRDPRRDDKPWSIRSERGGFMDLTPDSFKQVLQDLLS